jgi:hypothetical protein
MHAVTLCFRPSHETIEEIALKGLNFVQLLGLPLDEVTACKIQARFGMQDKEQIPQNLAFAFGGAGEGPEGPITVW